MSDERIYTEREKVLAKRAAFVAGCLAGFNREHERDGAIPLAAARYPLPKVTRPRVVRDSGGDEWRFTEENGLQIRQRGGNWEDTKTSWLRFDGARNAVADLLANPTEEVDAE